jgi:hypothetical protein
MTRKVILVAAMVFAICSGCNQNREPQVTPNQELNETYGKEVQELIDEYHLVAGSFPAKNYPDRLSEVVTDPFLTKLTPKSETPSLNGWVIVESVNIKNVNVLEHTSETFKAIACGRFNLYKVTTKGEFETALPPMEFKSLYVFLLKEGRWKLAVVYSIIDPDDAVAEWEYTDQEVRDLIGDISRYVHHDC